jgi:hypothetical protein
MHDTTMVPAPTAANDAASTLPSAPRYLKPDEYWTARPQFFASPDSFRWFVRHHRVELVEAGALICPTGRWAVQPEAFDLVLQHVGQRRAVRAAAS